MYVYSFTFQTECCIKLNLFLLFSNEKCHRIMGKNDKCSYKLQLQMYAA